MRVDDVKKVFLYLKKSNKTRNGTLEVPCISFLADKPAIFGEPNQKYIRAEIDWYLSESRNVNDLFKLYGQEVEIWKNICDQNGYINSNYGWCVFSPNNNRQYESVFNELRQNPYSRRAVIYYTRPTMYIEHRNGDMNDHICTTHVQYRINEENKLDALVYMRSNDAIFGYPNDLAWQKVVLGMLSDDLRIDKGDIYWNCGSLHIYERHYDRIK